MRPLHIDFLESILKQITQAVSIPFNFSGTVSNFPRTHLSSEIIEDKEGLRMHFNMRDAHGLSRMSKTFPQREQLHC